jgi:hypothetical protein
MSQQEGKVKGVADIVFLIDISGSMQKCIDALKANIGTFVNLLANPDPNGGNPVKDWRIKVAGYSDHLYDGNDWWVEFPFSNNLAQVTSNLADLKLAGGEDEPESLLDGLYKIAKLPSTEKGTPADPNSWRHRHEAARVVVFFTDASFHPTMSIPEAAGGAIDDVLNAVKAAKIIIRGFCPEHEGYFSLSEIPKCSLEFVSDTLGAEAANKLAAFTQDRAKFQKTLEALAKTVSKSSDDVATVAIE